MENKEKTPFKTKMRNFGSYLKKYWKTPPAGRYLSLKEATAYCVGGMGAVGASVIPKYVTLTAGNFIAVALGFKLDDIVLVGIITSIITILRSPLISLVVDNTNTKYGKFRPYLIWMPIPIMVTFFGFGFLDLIQNYVARIVIFTIIFNVMQFFMTLYSFAFSSLIQVISPKQSEKEWLMGFGSVAYSLGPSVVDFILPLVANFMLISAHPELGDTGDGLNVIAPYRSLIPIVLAVCFALGYWVAFGTRERIIQSKTKKQKVSFVRGVVNTSKNKYFWIQNISAVTGVFKLIGSSFTFWICMHAISTSWAQSVFGTILSTAYTPGMLLAPLLIKKFGKKNLTIFSNIACVVMTIPIIFVCIKPTEFTSYLILVLSYLIILVNSVQVVTAPAMTTQIYDYQQYKTGDRLEGFISQYGAIIGTLVGMGTAFIQPAIYKHFGFFGDNVEVLKNPETLFGIIQACCYLGIGSGIIGTVPYLFWDMTEEKHTRLIEILKVRALHDDGDIDEETATTLERDLEAGDGEALNKYILEHPLENAEDFISVKDDSKGAFGEELTSSEDLEVDSEEITTQSENSDIEPNEVVTDSENAYDDLANTQEISIPDDESPTIDVDNNEIEVVEDAKIDEDNTSKIKVDNEDDKQ